jgi:hypothetical protein
VVYAVPSGKWETTTTYGSDWKTVIRKETNGTVITEGFSPVKGRRFRLMLRNEKAPPSVGEWVLYVL